MAKFVLTYEGETLKKELHFRGEIFSYTMHPDKYGKTGDAPAFDVQVEKKYEDVEEDVLEALENLSFGSDEEIEEALALITDAE